MPITIDGLVSGIDTETIVSGLLEIQQQQIDRIELKRSDVLAKQATFSTLEARLLSLRSDVGQLARVQNSTFTKKSVSVSDENAVTATATAKAANGVYRLTVDSIARAHQVATQGLSDTDSEITQGTLELRLGAGDSKTITIDGTNNTLTGLTEAINAAGAGVSASIVKDAAGGSTPYRLLLTGTDTGTDNQISITNNLGPTAGNATKPVFDLGNPVQAASNSQVTVGSGVGAISVESSDNQFNEVIAGVNLNLLNSTSGSEITVTVAQDTEAAVEAVDDFVKSFNSVLSFIDDQSRFNADSEEGGILLGNRSAIAIQDKLRSAVLAAVPGVSANANRLSTIGITVTDSGRLSFNRTKLEDILNGRNEKVSAPDLKKLFALDATSTNAGISFVLGSSRTKATTDPIQVDITQSAAKATLTAAAALGDSTVIDASNRTLELLVDGAEATVSLSDGTYTRQELADHLEAVINNSSELLGRSVTVGLDTDSLKITSDSYGTSSDLRMISGTSLATLGFTAGAADVGRSVQGSFIVDGETEEAIGSGQLLSGDPENATTADLQLKVTLVSSQLVAGSEADLNVTRGIGATLDEILGDLLDPVSGGLATIDGGFDQELESLQVAIDRQQAIFDSQRESLISEFVALESALSQLQSTSSFLGTQLASLNSLQTKK